MLCTTLNAIRAHHPCQGFWKKLLKGLGKTQADDAPLPFERIVEICGIDDALWATRAAPEHDRVWRYFACACAYRVVRYSDDPRVRAAIETAERYADGLATDDDLSAARAATRAAARDAAGAAAWAAGAAAWAAGDAEREWQRKTLLEIVGGGS
jgi:hypothetical protein